MNTQNTTQVEKVSFTSGGVRCSGDLFRPTHHRKAPVIVMAHGLGGTKDMRLDAFAARFAAAGYVALTFDYRHFGESEGFPRQVLDIEHQLEDWKNAVGFARTLPEADTGKIILWGTSFGGGHVLTTAANVGNVAAVIAQCPFTDGLSSSLAMDPMTSLKVTALAFRDRIGALFGADPVMVPLVAPVGGTALMNADDAWTGYLALKPQGCVTPNYVAARFAFDIIRYYPGKKVAQIQAPILFCVCETDTVAPAKVTLKHASRAPNAEVKLYTEGHFEIYIGEAFERVVADQIDFLQRKVPVR